jgi:polysaccharide pyruvyl transferase WcaK-like protein
VLESGAPYRYTRLGARGGKRYYLPENLATASAFASLGRRLGALHPMVRELDRCDAVLDVSGGDSFSDIYGADRFWLIVRPKLLAAQRGVPLVLLPQTYGPFDGAKARDFARRAVLGAEIAWARDPYSFDALKELLGSDFDESRHCEGVDMAFNLGSRDPGDKVGPELRAWFAEKASHPLIGLNISGLVALDLENATRQFRLRANYLKVLDGFIREALSEPERRMLLVPHTMPLDTQGCERVLAALPEALQSRIRIAPSTVDEREVKWLIAQMDWFSGMRMHSTIAGLSSRVPTAAVAYSDKTRGIFATCGVEDQVIDPRQLGTAEVIERMLESLNTRERIAALLSTTIPGVKARAAAQFTRIVEMVEALG